MRISVSDSFRRAFRLGMAGPLALVPGVLPSERSSVAMISKKNHFPVGHNGVPRAHV